MRKKMKNEGLALFTVLSVMVILLILSLAVVSLSTANFKTTGNISSRLQALNLANAASIYGKYDIEHNFDPNTLLWGPGPTPTPPNNVSFTEYNYSTLEPKLNGLPGKCRVAYVNNLDNPNNINVNSPSMFPSVGLTTVSGETAVIIAQGEHNGFKRTIKVVLKYTDFAAIIADGVIDLADGDLSLLGIQNNCNFAGSSGSFYSAGDITYNNINNYKFLNGSKLVSSGNIPTPGSGNVINSLHTSANHPAIQNIVDWNIGDPNLTEGNPGNSANYVTYDPNDPNNPYGSKFWYRPPYIIVDSIPDLTINKPSFTPPYAPSPAINENEVYKVKMNTLLDISQNTFINGSLYISGDSTLRIQPSKKLFINGILIVKGHLNIRQDASLYIAGYQTDPNSSGVSLTYDRSTALLVDQIEPSDPSGAIFADGDIKLISWHDNIPSQPGEPNNVNTWLNATPDNEVVRNTFQELGIITDDPFTAMILFHGVMYGSPCWYNTPLNNLHYPPDFTKGLVGIPGKTGKEILLGQANNELLQKGYKPVPKEISNWFNGVDNETIEWASFNWDRGFPQNPNIFSKFGTQFINAVIYTHGNLTTNGTTYPISIMGGVFSKNISGKSPPGHGGNVNLTGSSQVILRPEYFKSGKPVIDPTLLMYSWEELH